MRPASHLFPMAFILVVIITHKGKFSLLWYILIPEFIHKKVKNSSRWWGAAFQNCLFFNLFVCPLLITAPSGWNLYTALTLVTSPKSKHMWMGETMNDLGKKAVVQSWYLNSAAPEVVLVFKSISSSLTVTLKGLFGWWLDRIAVFESTVVATEVKTSLVKT